METKKVTVIIPSYKAEKTIATAVISALDQGDRICQVIVLEDGVFDNTQNQLKKINDERLKLVSFPINHGAQFARNTGLEMAIGDYVIFLDSDDYFEGNLIEGMASALEKNNADLCFSPNYSINSEGKRSYFEVPEAVSSLELLRGRILSRMAVGIQCILWRKDFINRIGGWDSSVTRNQDGELVIRALISNSDFCVSKVGAGCSVQHDGDRVSTKRTIESYVSQKTIFIQVDNYLKSGKLSAKEKEKLRAALNWFCINVCIGLSSSGFLGSEYHQWRKMIDWKFHHFFFLPKEKFIQVLLFYFFGKKANVIINIIKKFKWYILLN